MAKCIVYSQYLPINNNCLNYIRPSNDDIVYNTQLIYYLKGGFRELLIEAQRKSLLKLFTCYHTSEDMEDKKENNIIEHITKMKPLNDMNW